MNAGGGGSGTRYLVLLYRGGERNNAIFSFQMVVASISKGMEFFQRVGQTCLGKSS